MNYGHSLVKIQRLLLTNKSGWSLNIIKINLTYSNRLNKRWLFITGMLQTLIWELGCPNRVSGCCLLIKLDMFAFADHFLSSLFSRGQRFLAVTGLDRNISSASRSCRKLKVVRSRWEKLTSSRYIWCLKSCLIVFHRKCLAWKTLLI